MGIQDSGQINVDRFEIVRTGIVQVVKGASTVGAQNSYTHNLGYVPAAIVFINNLSTWQPVPLSLENSNGVVYQAYRWYATTTDIIVQVATPNVTPGNYTGAITTSFKIYILRETAS
jgi:hypothetical protein